MQADTAASIPRLDEEIVSETVALGFEREIVVESVRKRVQNKASVTYFLLLDNRRRMPSGGYLAAELSEATATRLQQHPEGAIVFMLINAPGSCG